jgi:mannosylglycerate hydrolase
MKTKKAYIVPHTHWDREWRYPIWKNRVLLVEFMDELLETLENDERYRYFHLDGQAVIVEDYLAIRPEKEEIIKKFVKEDRLGIGPFYTLPDLYPIDGECIVRNIQKGMQVCKKYGGHVKVGYHSFGWGQIAQFPQIYNDLGFEFLIAAKHVNKDRAPEIEFLWQGPDGSEIITSRLGQHSRANLYFNAYVHIKHGKDYATEEFQYKPGQNKCAIHNAKPEKQNQDYFVTEPTDKKFHEQYIKESFMKAWNGYGETTVQDTRLLLNGSDFSSCQPSLPDIIGKANEAIDDIEFTHASLEEYVQAVLPQLKKQNLKKVTGALRDGGPANSTANALATRMYLKILNRKAQNLLIKTAEPLAALLTLEGYNYPKQLFDTAWEFMFKSHAHDSINGVTQDKTANDVEYHLNQAIEIAESIVEQASGFLVNQLKYCDKNDPSQRMVLINTLPFEREEVVKLVIDTPRGNSIWDFGFVDQSGNELPVQHISRKEKTATVYEMDCRSWPYYVDRHEVFLQTGTIPSFGYKTIEMVSKNTFKREAEWWPIVKTSKGDEISKAPGKLENAFLEMRLSKTAGTIDLFDKVNKKHFKGLNYFVDEGDSGDYWVNYPHYHNQLFDSRNAKHRSWISDNGPLAATLVIETTMQLPAFGYRADKGVVGESKRSSETKDLVIVSEFTLKKEDPKLYVKTVVNNNVEDHRLRLVFPTGIDCEKSYADSHFLVEERLVNPVKDENGEFYPGMQTLPMNRFVDVCDGKNGFSILTNSIGEYEMLRDNDHTLALTLFRSVENRICSEYRTSGYFPEQKGGKCLREMVFEYAIMPHAGNWKDSRIMGQAEKFNTSPIAYQLTPSDHGDLPVSNNLLEVSPSNLVVSTLKKPENGKGFLIRLYNPTDKQESITLGMHNGITSAAICNLIEEEKEHIEVKNNKINLKLNKGEIKTLRMIGVE